MTEATIGLLKFKPIFHYRIWGGEKLKNVLYKDCSEKNIGESWEISGVPNNETLVSEGAYKGESLKTLTKAFETDFVGEKCFEHYGNEFPILIKFIDAAKPLSVQVHPDDTLAKERHNSLGKNEMWFVMDSEKDADLIIGFNKKMNKRSYQKSIADGVLMSDLNFTQVEKGELYYLPAGRVHAIGQGVMLAEIQQTSDVTYRVYDYDRIDKVTGKQRDLHIEESIDAIDFKDVQEYKTSYSKNVNESNLMIDTPYFKANYINASKELHLSYKKNESFKIYICTEGNAVLKIENQEMSIKKGETILMAANEKSLTILPTNNVELLEASY
jgi:mannose-6-phosphate isomerase